MIVDSTTLIVVLLTAITSFGVGYYNGHYSGYIKGLIFNRDHEDY